MVNRIPWIQPRPAPEVIAEERIREMFLSLARRHLPGLYRFVIRQLAIREAAGDLRPGELRPEDIVDDTILRAYREFVRDHTGRSARSWMLGLAAEQLESRISRSRSEPERPAGREEPSTVCGETLYFYQPDEGLKLEDIIPDLHVPAPGQDTERRNLHRCLLVAFARLPREWRQALTQRHVRGLVGTDLARALQLPERETGRVLESARAYLRQTLLEAGCLYEAAANQ
jgi:DNA-directed RNA polymerase specialized sigma24 family protein